MTDLQSFSPSWTMTPGDFILGSLEDAGFTQLDAAARLGVSKKFINDLVKGRARISADFAQSLTHVLGSTPEFWLRLQANYDADVARRVLDQELESSHTDWMKTFPVAEMKKRGLLDQTSSKARTIRELLGFFSVANRHAWSELYAAPVCAFRQSEAFEKDLAATSVWLRQIELLSLEVDAQDFSKDRLKASLGKIRALSIRENFQSAWNELVEILNVSGVALIHVPPLRGCRVSGVTFFHRNGSAVIGVTGRYKRDDQFWFTLFHEIGHLLLHSKKLRFLEGLESGNPKMEEEANEFAAETLIPQKFAINLASLTDDDSILRFSEKIGIAPGIVVGRMQHEKLLQHASMNHLKKAIDFSFDATDGAVG